VEVKPRRSEALGAAELLDQDGTQQLQPLAVAFVLNQSQGFGNAAVIALLPFTRQSFPLIRVMTVPALVKAGRAGL